MGGRRPARPARLSLRQPTAEPRPAPIGLDGAIIYELHVGGFTRHPSSGVREPGTFSGLIEKIPYLQDLGITHVQLLPVAAFDEQDVPAPVAALGLKNYWGYSPVALASPHPGYAAHPDPATQVDEFRAMVQAFHAAGIGVLLDVVLNHTAEGGADGPGAELQGPHARRVLPSGRRRPTGTTPAAATPSIPITRWSRRC